MRGFWRERRRFEGIGKALYQIAGVVLFAKSLQVVSLTFQNLARFVL
ncbi:hypothetical protein HanPSC8_Chr08g0313631 [Helianthus annuus]|nr:hypothetical protein HanPSC8_Chr08g0313631 [Helianthus annuus]